MIPCPHCRQLHPPGTTFCPMTGQPLAAAPPQPMPPVQPPQMQMQMQMPPPQMQMPPPGAHIPHNYPLAISEPGLGTAIGLLMRTMPYAMVRFGVSMLASILTIVFWVIALGGGAWLGAKVAPAVGWIWAIGFLVAFGFFWRLILRYILYLIKCGHIAVLTELITKGQVANGNEGMFAYGKRIVTERFGQVNALFVVDMLVQGVVRTFNRTLDFIGSLLPVEALRQLIAIVQAVVRAATTYIDETIFSYGLAREERNPWASARDGLIYYAQNAKPILKTSVGIVLIDYAISFVVWLVMLAPAYAISRALPKEMLLASIIAWVIAFLFAGSIRASFVRPLFLIMVMVKFHLSVRGQPINVEWQQRLESVSDKFREITSKIASGWSPAPAQPAHPQPPVQPQPPQIPPRSAA